MTQQQETVQFLFGWPRFAGSVVHAVIDSYRDPDAEENRVAFNFGGERFEGTSGDPQFTLRQVRALCGVRGGVGECLRVTPGVLFSPDGYAGRPSATVCSKCVRIWSTTYAPAIEAWTKRCASCDKDVPASAFRSDKRTKDGMASVCEPCREASTHAKAEADRVLHEAGRAVEYLLQRRAWADGLVASLTAWQRSPWAPTFTCTTGQHALTAERYEWERPYEKAFFAVTPAQEPRVEQRVEVKVDVRWACPCGVAPVADHVRRLVRSVVQIDGGGMLGGDLGPVDVC